MRETRHMATQAESHSSNSGIQPVSPRQPYILAFVGENENGILRWWTDKILEAFTARGLSHQLIDLRDTAWREDLTACLAVRKPEFCFSFQGMGMALPLPSGGNLWERIGVPFVSCLGDNPYHAPAHHSAYGPGKYLVYGCEDFLQTYQNFMNGRAMASVLSTGYPQNPLADQTPWSKRKHNIVFVKTGIDPNTFTAEWDAWPKQVRELLHNCAARVLSGTNETVAVLCAEVFADRHIHWGERRELFLATCSRVDRYARSVRAQRMVTALMQHDALIVGHWPHLDRSKSRAVFQTPIAAEDLNALYSETRILINTLPTVRFGMHERILAGLFSKSVVVSETTPHLQQRLSRCPSFFGVDIDTDTFEEQLSDTLNSSLASARSSEDVQISARVAQELFSFDGFVAQLLDFMALEKHCETLRWWAFPPTN
jgi:hypothetical protein